MIFTRSSMYDEPKFDWSNIQFLCIHYKSFVTDTNAIYSHHFKIIGFAIF